jgi:ribosomal protein S27AE
VELNIFNPGYDVQCKQCSRVGPGVILRKVGDPRNFSALCGRCLALALQEVTKQNWLSQFTLWQANSELGKRIQKEKLRVEEES